MAAVTTPFECGQGETFNLAARYKDAAGDPIDLTGWTGTFRLLRRTGVQVAAYSASTDVDGWVRATVADEVTATWPTGELFYRLEVETPEGDRRWLAMGPFQVSRGF